MKVNLNFSKDPRKKELFLKRALGFACDYLTMGQLRQLCGRIDPVPPPVKDAPPKPPLELDLSRFENGKLIQKSVQVPVPEVFNLCSSSGSDASIAESPVKAVKAGDINFV